MIKLLILGPTGIMGKLISELALNEDGIEVVAACDVNNIGEELGGLLAVKDRNKIKISDVNYLQKVIDETKPDVAVDFTVAKATEKNCKICVENGIKCVIGTTAMTRDFLDEFEKLVKTKKAPAVISPNMATGVNILFKMASILTKYLNDWDIEVIETHHNRKLDSPSGTALKIGQIVSESLGVKIDNIAKYGRDKGYNKRKIGGRNEIGFHSIRAGDIVGDHIILYAGPGERIELKHQAHSRSCFATGAIKAVKFIAQAKENKIYTTNEILGL
ncbi:MAG: 4-hydroxy-tetrahydrodipicolinate reductase [Promethearchaeota archaeon]